MAAHMLSDAHIIYAQLYYQLCKNTREKMGPETCSIGHNIKYSAPWSNKKKTH
jgi:hypothetical protein